MFLKGFGSSHAIFIQSQLTFAVLIKGFYRPTMKIGLNNEFSSGEGA
jgi:hypothetical protein